MKKFIAEILVNLKPSIKDVKGLTLKNAAEHLVELDGLKCRVGSFYTFEFFESSREAASEKVDLIASEILANQVIEEYKIVKLEEVDG